MSVPAIEGRGQGVPHRAHFNFTFGGSRVAQCDLIEQVNDGGGTSQAANAQETRRFTVLDGSAGTELIDITLGGIHRVEDDTQAQVTITELSEDSRVSSLPMAEIVDSALGASGVTIGLLNVEQSPIQPALLAKTNFAPTEQQGIYAVAA